MFESFASARGNSGNTCQVFRVLFQKSSQSGVFVAANPLIWDLGVVDAVSDTDSPIDDATSGWFWVRSFSILFGSETP